MVTRFRCLAGFLMLCASSIGAGQDPAPILVSPAAVPSPAPHCPNCIPALTPVELVIDSDLGSKISKTGDTFPIHLAKPVIIDGREVIPAGAVGQGEVVHAKKAGGSGSGGELVLAARYLDISGQRLRLRSLQLSSVGKDQMQLALAAAQAISLFAFAITGKNSEITKGQFALAKTAEAFPASQQDAAIEPKAEPKSSEPSAVPSRQEAAQ